MPTLSVARTNLGDAFTRKANAHNEAGELDEAVNTYLELKKLYPNELHIRNLLGELYLKKGRLCRGTICLPTRLQYHPEC